MDTPKTPTVVVDPVSTPGRYKVELGWLAGPNLLSGRREESNFFTFCQLYWDGFSTEVFAFLREIQQPPSMKVTHARLTDTRTTQSFLMPVDELESFHLNRAEPTT